MLKYTSAVIFVLSLIIIGCAHIPPNLIYLAGIVSYAIPIIIILNVLLAIFLLFKDPVFLIFPLSILIIGKDFITSSIAFNTKKDEIGIDVLSYNLSFFKHQNSNFKRWLVDRDIDILCFQEFINDSNSKSQNLINFLNEDHIYNFAFSTVNKNIHRLQYGVIIFSKYPMVEKGELLFSDNNHNRGVYADLQIENDTVRIINVHFQSMMLKNSHPIQTNGTSESKKNIRSMFYKIKQGVIARGDQVDGLYQFINESPHKVILCGDFNETPYSYAYQLLKQKLENAFEKAGNGFGITYTDNTLFFLRIDHQFYDPAIKILNYQTLSDISFSDHYPILGTYNLK